MAITLYAPPAVPAFPAGWAPQAADFTGWVTNTLGFQLQGVVFRAVQVTPQILTGATVINYDSVLEDPYSGWTALSPPAGFPNSAWIAPFTGWYQIEAFCSVSVASVNFQMTVTVDGFASYSTTQAQLPSSTMGGGSAFAVVNLVGGTDYVQAVANPNTSQTNDTSNVGREPSMDITFISQ